MLSKLLGPVAIVLIVLLLCWFLASRYKTPTTNEAIIVSGSTRKDDKGLKVLTSHGGFVWPILQRAVTISLRSHQTTTESDAVSKDKIGLHLKVVATFKVGETDEDIRKAAQRYSGQENKIDTFMGETIEGSMRDIVGTMTVEDLLTDRQSFSDKMRNVILDSIESQGLKLDNLQIQDISDDNDYISNLGKPQEAAVKQAAVIAEQKAEQESKNAEIAKEKSIALANKELSIQQAAIDEETNKRKAEAEAAGPIAKAEQEKKIADAQREVEEANVAVTQAKLKSDVNAKADADKYKVETDAEAQADVTEKNARAEAEAIKARGNADAEAKKSIGLAEAEAMEKKAEAYKKYSSAALQSAIIEQLPEIAKAISEPLRGAKFTSIGADANDQTTGVMANLAAKVPEFINTLTGVDMAKSFRSLAGQGYTQPTLDETQDEKGIQDLKEDKSAGHASENKG